MKIEEYEVKALWCAAVGDEATEAYWDAEAQYLRDQRNDARDAVPQRREGMRA